MSRTLDASEWERLINILDHTGLLRAQTMGLTRMLRDRVKHVEPVFTSPMLQISLRLAEKLLPITEDVPFVILSKESWLLQAINHPGGQLAEFVIQAADGLLESNTQQGCGLPRPCLNLLSAMVEGTGNASAMSRVILAARVRYFLGIDPSWTQTRLLPLFDWTGDRIQAAQAWHGFLTWGRPDATLLEALTPSATQLASHLKDLDTERKLYGKFIARASFSLPDSPLSKRWFKEFMIKADDDDRAYFSWELGKLLKLLRPEQKETIWQDWLKSYLDHRSQYPPRPGDKELGALFGWSLRLPGQLAELVSILEGLPGQGADVDRLLWKLRKGDLSNCDSSLRGRLLLASLNHSHKVNHGLLREALINLRKELVSEELILKLEEKYLESGGLSYPELGG